MAEINVERKPAGNYTWALVALSLVLIAGFFWWLSVNAEPTSGPIVQEETEEEVEPGVTTVTLAELESPQALLGQVVRIEQVPVGSRMGSQAFWAQLPNQNPFLFKLPSGEQVSSGETVGVTGTVVQMTDSVLTAWQESGAIADEIELQEAQFAEHFVDATRVRHAGGAAQQGGQGQGEQQPSGQ